MSYVGPLSLILFAAIAATGVPVETSEDVFECEGDGLIHVVPDECMHDGGKSAAGDSLEVYCHLGTARFCLSGEECPWREAPAGGGDETCSRAGLDADWMATAWCEAWSGFDHYACTDVDSVTLGEAPEVSIFARPEAEEETKEWGGQTAS